MNEQAPHRGAADVDHTAVDAGGIRVDPDTLGAVQLARTDTPCRAGGMGGARPQ